FNFDGVDDLVEAQDSSSLKPAQLTLEAWVRPASSGLASDATLITKTSSPAGSDGYGLGYLGSTSTFGFWLNDRAGNRITTSLAAGVWSHVAATYDGANMRLYVNGAQVAAKAYATAINHSSDVLRIGNNGGGSTPWNGGLDELVIYSRALSLAEVLSRYNATISGNNGMPIGLAVNSTTGSLSGIPTSVPGTYNFSTRASDASGCFGVRNYALVIACPVIAITPTTLPNATQYAAYSAQTLLASGGTSPYTWSLFSGALPTGMTLNSAGVLSGTVGGNPGDYNFTVQSRDANNCTATRAYTLTVVCPPITLSATTFANAQQFVSYTAQTVTASGGNSPYTFAITSGALPAGMSLTTAGMVSGTPTAIPGTYNFTLEATDARACKGTRAYSITVTCPMIAVAPVSLSSARQFDLFSETLTASGGNGSYTWNVSSGALPAGLNLSAAGVISGTTTAAPGNYSFTARAVDAQVCAGLRAYTLTVTCPTVTVSPLTLPSGTATIGYSQALSAGGGTAAYTYSIQSGALPTGITLSSAGLISGTTSQIGGFNFVALATDANGCTGQRAYTLSISCPTISISPASLPDATTSVAYSQTLTATGGVGAATWTLVSGSLPTGITLSSAGLVSGTPSGAPGAYSFTVRAADTNNCEATRSYVINLLCPTLSISTASLSNGTTGVAYSQNLAVTGGTAPHAWSLQSGTLPAGLALSPSGVISGVPTVATTVNVTILVKDAFDCSATKNFTLTTACPAVLTLTPASLSAGNRGVAYTQTLNTAGGTAPYAYTLSSGSLPAGLSMSGAGVITGTPTGSGSSTFSVTSTDTYGCPVTVSRTINVTAMTLGDLVWNDLDQDGSFDVGESGVSGVSLQLFSSTNLVIGDADDVSVGTTTTNGSGIYTFANLAPARYYVRIATPPAGLPFSSGIIVTTDDGVNNDNNGAQSGGSGTAVTSPLITLAIGREPGDFTGGGDSDASVDFAFRAVPAATPLLEYDMNISSGGLPAPPSFQNPCIVSSAKIQVEEDLNGLTDVSEPAFSGPIKGGALSRRVRDWDDNFDAAYGAARTSLTQNRDSLWVRFDMDPTATGNLGKLLMDVRRVNSSSPVNGRAYLTWNDGANFRTALTDAFVISAQPAWYSMNLNWTSFLGGATALPTGAQLAGKNFLLEIYLWGGDSTGYIDFDNIVLEGSATCAPPTLSVGDFVWSDLNCNGLKNSREPGLPGVTVELWRAGADNTANTSDDALHASMVTDANGYYLFSGLAAGQYFVKIPTPSSDWPTAAPAVNLDNGVDNDSNGLQPGGTGTAVNSPVITLALSTEPGSSGATNRDMSIDFGFCASMSIGNLVFSDLNNNGLVDVGEGGVSGVQVELFRSTDTTVNNLDDVKIGSTFTTNATGAYGFSGMTIGRYYVKLTPPLSHPRRSSTSSSTDNGVDNDNNGITQSAAGAPIYSMMVTLSALTEPGNLLAPFGSNAETTIDFGLRPVFVSVGNLVFKDGNSNNRFDTGEGVGNVRVDLLTETGVFVRSVTTSNSTSTRGQYIFTSVIPGNYFVRIPPSEFGVGMALANTLSIVPSTPIDDDQDDNQTTGDSGMDNATPVSNGVSSPLLALFEDTLPTFASGETGYGNTLDDSDDDNGNMTVDFGFRSTGPTETGCYHFVFGDNNQDGSFLNKTTEWTPGQAVDFNYAANIAYIDNFDLIYDAPTKRLVLDASFTQLSGRKVDAIWMLVSTGSNPATDEHAVIYVDGFNRGAPQLTIYRYDPAQGHLSWQNTANIMVSTATGGVNGADVLQDKVTEVGSSVRFQFTIDVNRVNTGSNWTGMGVNAAAWEGLLMAGTSGVVLRTVDLTSAPTYDGTGRLTAFSYTPGITSEGTFETDPAGVLTIATEPCSVSPWVSLGNLVWSDTNWNGLKDSSELGVSGATVQLFDPGADLAVGGTGLNADTQVGSSLVTGSSGAYNFTNLVPGKYYVRVTPPTTFPASGGLAVTLDNNVDNDNNGSQPGGPGTHLFSPIIDLAVGAEPISSVDGDGTSGNTTVDFGLWSGFTIGDLVWSDLNNNGLKDTTETGVSGVTVELMNPGADGFVGGVGLNADSVLMTTSTNSSGAYSFRSYTQGLHYVRITPTAALSLASSVVVSSDNGSNNDNNGTQPGGAGSDINSMIIMLTPGNEPGNTGTTNNETTIDFGLRGCPAITISPASVPVVTLGTPYSQPLTGSGGNTPYTWSLSAGSLPSGLSLNSSGVIGGTTTATTGNYNITVRLTDLSGCQVTRAYTVTLVCPALVMSPSALSSGVQGSAYSQMMAAGNGTTPYTWTVPVGTLPPGLTLSTGGSLSGAPTLPGSYTFTIRATDARNCVVDTGYTLAISCPTLTVSPASVLDATLAAAYSPTNFTVSGGAAPYTWSTTGMLPTGMSLSSAGALSGTPSGAPGLYNFTVIVTDANLCSGSRAIGLTVNCGSFSITPATLPASTQYAAYTAQTISASGGTAPYTWSISSGGLPTGMSLSSAGVVSGAPTATPGTYNFTARATDGFACQSTRSYAFVVNCPPVAVATAALNGAVQFTSFTQTLTANSGTAPYSWTLTAGTLPTGMNLSTSGVLSGTPTQVGTFPLTFRAADTNGCTATRALSLTVACPLISLTPTTLTNAQNNTAYNQQLSATGGTSPYVFSRISGAIPTGMTFTSQGLLFGSPISGPGNYTFTIQALDASGTCSGSQSYTLTVTCPTITLSPATLSNGTVGTSYTSSLSSTGGTAPYAYSILSGSLPAGLSVSASGLISGTPTAAATASFTIQSRDAFNCTGTRAYTLTTICPTITITPSTLDDAYYNLAYSQQLSAAGGTGPYTWSVVAGVPPSGITLSSTGLLSGTSIAFGMATFSVRATDAYGCQSTISTSLTVKGLAIGDLVWDDDNFNGIHDPGEAGVKDVTVQLWDPGADNAIGGTGPDADVQVGADKTTSAFGTFAFQNLLPGYYYLRVFPPTNLPLPGGFPVDADNGIDNDNNSAQQPDGSGAIIYGPVVELSTGSETIDEDGDHDTDFTVDFGLYRGLTIGNPGSPNYVWQDTNDNGTKNAGEPGIDGVTVQLWFAGSDQRIGGNDDALRQTVTTSGGGKYSFANLTPGTYYLRIPTTPAAQPLSSSTTALLDNGVNDDDNGHQVAAGSVYSPLITLTSGQEASGGGYNEDTIDFGLIPVTPTVYLSATQDDSIQTYNAASGQYTGALRHPFGASHNQGDGNPFDVPYGMELGPDGNWYVAHFGDSNLYRLSPSGVQTASVLNTSNAVLSQIQVFAIGPDGNFYVVDHNGGRIVRFAGPLSSTPGMPMGTSPFTFLSQAGIQDIAFGPDGNLYLVVQTGSTREIRRYNASTGAQMNVIATDSQIVSMVAGGQPVSLVSGIDIHGSTLYGVNRSDGEIFRISLTNPAAPGAPQIVATISSAGKGEVDTRDLEYNPKDDQLYVTGYNWGKPVIAGTYSSGAILRVSLTGTVDIFEAPIPTPPGPNNEIWAGPRDIALGKPFSNVAETVAVGSLVWNDTNANGIHDAGENGIPNVRVEIWRDLDGLGSNGAESRVGWTFTNSRGMYYFSGEDPGVYQLKVSSHNFTDGQPLAGSGFSSPVTITTDNQIDGDDNGIQVGGNRTEAVSPLITLTPGSEPLGNGASGVEVGVGGELDNFITDANGDMTVDFGFVEPGIMALGNLVFNDANGNRRFDNGEGLDGVAVQLYYWGQTPGASQPLATTVTANGGRYLFSNLWQGQYFVHLPAAQFQSTGYLRGLFSLQDVQAGDDDVGEDSIDTLTPFTSGLSTGRIIMTVDSAPTNSSGETGVDATSDDSDDANTDLTVDFGLFRPVAIGNLVFFDGNANGRADSGEGIDGVSIQLYSHDQAPGVDTPIASATTGNGGKYLFSFLRPGNYRLHIPAAMFQNGALLFRRVSMNEGLSGDDDSGEDGLNDGDPAAEGVSTNIVTIFPGAAPTDITGESGIDNTTDNDNDASVDLTVDFGFQTPVGLGNLVFVDSNGNGRADPGEGVDDVTVEIYNANQTPGSVTPLFTQSTQNGG
ncbi:MAG: putative Ig domain-containing protein, partial [Verrucomicrobia bacterium]|nr:putative Ig domain-containing protein [Verrucomicrobiota bacterium]